MNNKLSGLAIFLTLLHPVTSARAEIITSYQSIVVTVRIPPGIKVHSNTDPLLNNSICVTGNTSGLFRVHYRGQKNQSTSIASYSEPRLVADYSSTCTNLKDTVTIDSSERGVLMISAE